MLLRCLDTRIPVGPWDFITAGLAKYRYGTIDLGNYCADVADVIGARFSNFGGVFSGPSTAKIFVRCNLQNIDKL